jgi:hypothetical protein
MLLESLNLDIHLIAAANIASASKDASTLASGFASDFWSNIFQMGLFGRVVKAALPIAGVGVIYKGYNFYQDLSQNVLDLRKLITGILSILLVWLMLVNSGQYSMYAVIGLRNYTGTLSDTLMAGISTDFQVMQASRGSNISAGGDVQFQTQTKPALQGFQAELNRCRTALARNPSCISNAFVNLKNNITALQLPSSPSLTKFLNDINTLENDATTAQAAAANNPQAGNGWFDGWFDGAKAVVSVVTDPGNVFQQIILLLLTGLAIAFFFAIELAMLIFGLTFPINLALSLFDPAPLKSWIGNFWSLINAKLCFSIIVGIIVYLQIWIKGSSNGFAQIGLFVIEFLLAIFAPVATFFYCQGSALALAGALNSALSAPMRGVAGGAGKALGAIGGGAAKSFGAGVASRTSKIASRNLKQAGAKMGDRIGAQLAKKIPLFREKK